MNWGARITWISIALSLAASIGYLIAEDPRRALYFFFAACITMTVVWQ